MNTLDLLFYIIAINVNTFDLLFCIIAINVNTFDLLFYIVCVAGNFSECIEIYKSHELSVLKTFDEMIHVVGLWSIF